MSARAGVCACVCARAQVCVCARRCVCVCVRAPFYGNPGRFASDEMPINSIVYIARSLSPLFLEATFPESVAVP